MFPSLTDDAAATRTHACFIKQRVGAASVITIRVFGGWIWWQGDEM